MQMLDKLLDFHILYLACIIIPIDFIESRRFYRSILLLSTTIGMYIFINTKYIWVLFITWEILGIISSILIYNSAQDVKKCMHVLGMNLLSGTLFLFTIINLPYNSSYTAIDLSSYLSQISLALAICIKSGLWPFTWPQHASIAKTPITAFLHSATVIQLGVYLLLKLHIQDYMFTIIYCSSCFTFIWALFKMNSSVDLKQKIGILTQCFTAITLIQVCNHTSDDIINKMLAMHALYKSLIFIYYNKININQTYTPIDIIYISLGFIIGSKVFLGSDHDTAFCILNSCLVQYVFFTFIKLILTKKFTYKISYIDVLYLLSIIALLKYQFSKFIYNPIKWFNIYLLLCLPQETIIDNPLYNFVKRIQMPTLVTNKIKLNLPITQILLYIILAIVAYIEFSLPIKYLITSRMNLFNIIIISIGLHFLIKAKNKYEVTISMNLISSVIAFNFIQHGGIDICITHILADTLITFAMLRSFNLNARLSEISPKKLLICALIALAVILSHPGYRNGMVFPLLHQSNIVNEIVINWRLFDTLGELIVFYGCGRVIQAMRSIK